MGKTCLQVFCKNEGLLRLQWPYFVQETLLHYCSTQLKVLTNVFCLEYCTKVLYVYSFMNVFLNPYTTMECCFFCHPVCYLVYFDDFFQGFRHRKPPTFTVLYSVCPVCFPREQLHDRNEHEFRLAKCIFIYLHRHDGFRERIAALPLAPLNFSSLSYRADICTLIQKMFAAWFL